MSPAAAWRRAAQVMAAAVVVAVVVTAVRFLTADTGGPEQPDLAEGEVGVAEAIGVAGEDPLVVTGYVFEGAGWPLRLCAAHDGGDPPRCVGPFLYLAGVDARSFALDDATTDDGPLRYSTGAVTVHGTILGTEMTVSVVLG